MMRELRHTRHGLPDTRPLRFIGCQMLNQLTAGWGPRGRTAARSELVLFFEELIDWDNQTIRAGVEDIVARCKVMYETGS